jgi:hypothetical protein
MIYMIPLHLILPFALASLLDDFALPVELDPRDGE